MSYHRLCSTIELPLEPIRQNNQHFAWWVKITTARPRSTYYFGPFDCQSEAIESQSGYIQDLMQEEARVVSIEVKQENPRYLTISES